MITALTPLAFYRRAEELLRRKVGLVDGDVSPDLRRARRARRSIQRCAWRTRRRQR